MSVFECSQLRRRYKSNITVFLFFHRMKVRIKKNEKYYDISIRHFYQKITKCERNNNSSTLAVWKAFCSTLHQIWSVGFFFRSVHNLNGNSPTRVIIEQCNNMLLFRISILSIRYILFGDGTHDPWWSLFWFYYVDVHSKAKENIV